MARKKRTRRSYGSGSAYQNKKTGEWFAALPWPGRKRPRVVRAADEPSAYAKLEALTKERDAGLNLDGRNTSLRVYASQWLVTEGRLRKWEPKTAHNNRQRLELYVMPDLGDMRLGDLKKQDVLDWLHGLEDEGYAANTIRGTFGLLKRILEAAVDDEYLLRNVAARIELPPLEQEPRVPLSIAETRQLYASLEQHRLLILYELTALYGLRRGEVLGLRWSEINFETMEFAIREQVGELAGKPHRGKPKTKASVRTLPLTRRMAERLRYQWVQLQRERTSEGWHEHGLMFPSEVGTVIWPRNLSRHFKLALVDAGLSTDFHFHDLRHTAATRLKEGGADDTVIGAILGHSKKNVTQGYIHVKDLLRRALEAAEGLVWGETTHELTHKMQNAGMS